MKQLISLALILIAINTYGQSDTGITKGLSLNRAVDTVLKVVYVKDFHHSSRPVAYYVNDKLVGQTIMTSLNPTQIQSLDVVKDDVEIDGVQYYGKIYVKIKGDYAPKPITLNELKKKYVNLENKPTIFMIDGEIIKDDYDQYVVDEKYLLRIIVDKINNAKENIDFNLIKLLTKSAANIKSVNEIRIRGAK
jgi:hypothetical protein